MDTKLLNREFILEELKDLYEINEAQNLFVCIKCKEKKTVIRINEIDNLLVDNLLSYNKKYKVLLKESDVPFLGKCMYIILDDVVIRELEPEQIKLIESIRNKMCLLSIPVILGESYLEPNDKILDNIIIKDSIENDKVVLRIYNNNKLILKLDNIGYINKTTNSVLIRVIDFNSRLCYSDYIITTLYEELIFLFIFYFYQFCNIEVIKYKGDD